MDTNVETTATEVDSQNLTIEEILEREIMQLPIVVSPYDYAEELCAKCEKMTIAEFLIMGFPTDLIDVVYTYSRTTKQSVKQNSTNILAFIENATKSLPVVKPRRRLLV